ncbi:MAG TPA: YfaZ family outer membrane protein [Geopsychrobacteraceae bacterium]|jgi:hypothetical protein
MLRLMAVFLLVVSVPGAAWAGSLALNFNNESAQFRYQQLLNREAYSESEAGLRLLYNEDTETWLATVGAAVKGSPGNLPGLKTGVEIAVNGSDTRPKEMLAIGIGLRIDYAPPVLHGLGMTAAVQFAPKVFSFLDAERYLETSVGLAYAFMPQADLTLDYQNILVDFENAGEVRVDDSLRIGVKLRF